MSDNNDQRVWGLQGLATELLRHKGLAAEGQSIAETQRVMAESAKHGAEVDADIARMRERTWKKKAQDSDAALAKANEALAQKEALLKEWMHSNEAFKRLARKYGKKLGLSDEQRVNDYDDVVLEVAEDKPEFADTKTLKEVKEARGIK